MLMRVPESIFWFILHQRNIEFFPWINPRYVYAKRAWEAKSDEEKAEFSKMRSKVQKRVYKKLPKVKKKEMARRFSEGMQRFWDNVDPQDKAVHVEKMRTSMKERWDSGDPEFGSRLANEQNLINMRGNIKIIEDCPRINDYAGVITMSQMEELNG